MPHDALHASAQALSEALDNNDAALSPEERAQLVALRDALSQKLDREDTAPAPELNGIIERTIATLEGSHPDLTAALGVLAETLSELGI